MRLRMVWTSCKTALDHMWWGCDCPLPGVPALRGNMVVAMCMASPSMVYRSVARESTESLSPNIGPVGSKGLDGW